LLLQNQHFRHLTARKAGMSAMQEQLQTMAVR